MTEVFCLSVIELAKCHCYCCISTSVYIWSYRL